MNNITPISKTRFNAQMAPVKWSNNPKPVSTKEKGLTVAELINKLINLAASGEINLNTEVQVFDQDGKYVGVGLLQKGPGSALILR